MPDNNILIDETLDFNKSKLYQMSILILKSGLSFLIFDEQANKIIAHKYQKIVSVSNEKEYCYFLNKIFNTDVFFKYEYKKISVIYQSFKSITIPDTLYLEEYKESFFQLNVGFNSKDVILSNRLTQMNARKLFSIPQCVLEVIENNFSEAKIYHQNTPVIQSALKNKSFQVVYLSLNNEFVDIQVFNKKSLVLDNSFKYKTKEDLLYYLLYTFEQLGLDTKHQKIIIFSNLDVDNSMILFIKKYLGNIKLSSYPKNFNYSYLFSKKKSHQLASQILSLECE